MGNTDNHVYEVEYERWGRVVVKAQLIIALVVFVIELINNALQIGRASCRERV